MDFESFLDVERRLNLRRIGKPALVGVVLILIMVAVLATGRISGTATASNFAVVSGGESTSSEALSDSSPADQATIFVHVSGAVVNPGLYEIRSRSRVADAVQAAGGFTDDASPDSVNLARTLNDGEHIIIARLSDDTVDQCDTSSADDRIASAHSLVNINTATATELETLPGIGASTAAKIIEERETNGPFKTLDDLKRVSGIGDKKFESLEKSICI